MSDDLEKRLRFPPFGTETSERNLMAAAADEIARLRAELATARREGRNEMAEDVAGWHEARAKEHDAMEREFKTIGQHLAPDTMQSAMRCAEAAIQHRQRAAAIRAAAGEVK
jgi:hypothetical protein